MRMEIGDLLEMCIRDRAYAPYLLLMSMAVEVPTAWAAVPIESPWAIGLLSLIHICHD